MSDYYNSKYTGEQIDEGIGLALAHEDTIEQLATKAESFVITLSATSWSNNKLVVSNSSFVVNGFAYSVAPNSNSHTDYANAGIYAEDILVDGQIIFNCSEVPLADITVNILKVEVVQ